MRIHNYIKITYTNIGYLPGYPYHLISDKEMFDAFLREDGFLADYYPCPCEDLQEAYDTLVADMTARINDFLENETELPAWIYSYMIQGTIGPQSEEEDISYLYDLCNMDSKTTLAEFSPELARRCYSISKKWIERLPSKYADRPYTMFGEPHVVKSLRLDQANILLD